MPEKPCAGSGSFTAARNPFANRAQIAQRRRTSRLLNTHKDHCAAFSHTRALALVQSVRIDHSQHNTTHNITQRTAHLVGTGLSSAARERFSSGRRRLRRPRLPEPHTSAPNAYCASLYVTTMCVCVMLRMRMRLRVLLIHEAKRSHISAKTMNGLCVSGIRVCVCVRSTYFSGENRSPNLNWVACRHLSTLASIRTHAHATTSSPRHHPSIIVITYLFCGFVVVAVVVGCIEIERKRSDKLIIERDTHTPTHTSRTKQTSAADVDKSPVGFTVNKRAHTKHPVHTHTQTQMAATTTGPISKWVNADDV